ncbi:MAG: 4Fe-4S binding protein [Anaerolineales bacterium]|nr:4Fe-4S binding protein [Anaerolineales bacterium]
MKSHPTTLRESNPSPTVRTIIQIIFLVVTILIGLRHILPGEGSKGGAFDAFCPFGAIETLWSYLAIGETLKTTNLLNFSIIIGVLGVTLLAGRAFCGWMCPIGTLQDFLADLSARISKKIKNPKVNSISSLPYRISERNNVWLRSLKYLILGVILLASTWAIYPPLREICPARAIFSFQLTTPLLWSVLITFVITSLLNRRFWCKYLCPLGAVLAPFNKIAPLRLVVNQNSCTSCKRCDADCPMDILNIPENLRSAECTQCLECLETCAVQDTFHIQLG